MSPAIASAPPKSKVALVAHVDVAEAAVVGFDHDIKGQAIYAFVTLNVGVEENEACANRSHKKCARKSARLHCPTYPVGAGFAEDTLGKIMRAFLESCREQTGRAG